MISEVTQGKDPMEVDHIGKDTGRGNGKEDKEVLRVRKERSLHTRQLVTNPPGQNSEQGGGAKKGWIPAQQKRLRLLLREQSKM